MLKKQYSFILFKFKGNNKIQEVIFLQRRKANHVIPGANAAKGQGQGAGFNEEMANEPLTEMEKKNNKKRKKNQ
jgi:small acid-soluble spore protein O (minor)